MTKAKKENLTDVIKFAREYIQWELIDWTKEDYVRCQVRGMFESYLRETLEAEFLNEQGNIDVNLKPYVRELAQQIKCEDISFTEDEIKEITAEIKKELKERVKENIKRHMIHNMGVYATRQYVKMEKAITASIKRTFDKELKEALSEEEEK